MGRPEWMSRLLAGICDEDGRRDWPAIVASATGMFRLAAQGRLRSAGELLAERYIETSQRHAGSYAAWVRKYDTLSVADREAMASRGQALAVDGPKISLLVPVYQTPERWLRSRSEEHTSELQSLMRISYAVFCLKKKKNIQRT